MYLRKLQRFKPLIGYLPYNVHPIHHRDNLPNIAHTQVPEVVLATLLKHVHAVVGLWRAAHDRKGRFQAVLSGYPLAIAVVIGPVEVVVHLLFVCCPVLWWDYCLGS